MGDISAGIFWGFFFGFEGFFVWFAGGFFLFVVVVVCLSFF